MKYKQIQKGKVFGSSGNYFGRSDLIEVKRNRKYLLEAHTTCIE